MKQILRTVPSLLLLFALCGLLLYTPFQDVSVAARTPSGETSRSGEFNLYVIRPLKAGETYRASITFEAVPSASGKLFTRFGSGQIIRYGCSPLKASVEFVSVGRFVRIRLALDLPDSHLSLADGSPLDLSRYALKPVWKIESLSP